MRVVDNNILMTSKEFIVITNYLSKLISYIQNNYFAITVSYKGLCGLMPLFRQSLVRYIPTNISNNYYAGQMAINNESVELLFEFLKKVKQLDLSTPLTNSMYWFEPGDWETRLSWLKDIKENFFEYPINNF